MRSLLESSFLFLLNIIPESLLFVTTLVALAYVFVPIIAFWSIVLGLVSHWVCNGTFDTINLF